MTIKQSKCNLKSRPVDVPALAEEILKENRFALIVPHGCKAPQFPARRRRLPPPWQSRIRSWYRGRRESTLWDTPF